eukprot:TRINITY_DN6101_c0_g1_i1.p1 TRINITY_DN6101_c0_g1~~TRINITY_DN6101_c0_g1_i1.p1  ORF type:complete len:748 (+),score=143.69 TRINITY_DN6101_c0_g1_i1:85-2328(+)
MKADIVHAEFSNAGNGVGGSADEVWDAYVQTCQVEASHFLAVQLQATEILVKRLQLLQPKAAVELRSTLPVSTSKQTTFDLSHAGTEEMEDEKTTGSADDYILGNPLAFATAAAVAEDCHELHSAATPDMADLDDDDMIEVSMYGEGRTLEERQTAMRRSNSSEGTTLSVLEAECLHNIRLTGHRNSRNSEISCAQQAVQWSLESAFGKDASIVQNFSTNLELVKHKRRGGLFYKLVESHTFHMVSFLVILLNTLFIVDGLNASMDVACGRSPGGVVDWTSDVPDILDAVLLFYFAVEVTLRLYAHGAMFFLNREDRIWNISDLVLVFVSGMAMLLSFSARQTDESTKGAAAVRSARLFKATKMVRVVRTARFFKQLDKFVSIILNCFQNLLWAVLTIILLLVMFSVYFVFRLEIWMSNNWTPDGTEDIQRVASLIEKTFGSVSLSMLTLIASLSNGKDWQEVYELFAVTGTLDWVVFLTMQAFFQIAVWNIVTSLFIENTFKAAIVDREDQALAHRRRDTQDAKEFYELCQQADDDKSGTISLTEFEKFMAKPDTLDFFAAKELDIHNATNFFKILSVTNGVNEVAVDDIVGTLMRLKGNATSFDLQMLALEHRHLAERTKQFIHDFHSVQETVANMSRQMDQFMSSAAPGPKQTNRSSTLSRLSLLQLQPSRTRKLSQLSMKRSSERQQAPLEDPVPTETPASKVNSPNGVAGSEKVLKKSPAGNLQAASAAAVRDDFSRSLLRL